MGLVFFSEAEPRAGATDQPGALPAGVLELRFDQGEGGAVLPGVDQCLDAFVLQHHTARQLDTLLQSGKPFLVFAEPLLELAADEIPVHVAGLRSSACWQSSKAFLSSPNAR